ncbi:hypothetical protein [Bacillus thuringiensis]|uniref:hypothetical protein n=1 Tax=Bacillus thuringiensis TaxID=1428 RepID=UPI0011A6D033|nr:hypothetical protein [Bacillus thuringiensis]
MSFWIGWIVFWAIVLVLAIGFIYANWDCFTDKSEYILVALSVFAIGLGFVQLQNYKLQIDREMIIAGKLDVNKLDVNFNHIQSNVYAKTKDGEYKYVFKEDSTYLINWEKQSEEKGSNKKSNEPSLKNEEKVREMVANKLNLQKDEVVVTKDKENLYTVITPSGKYVVETEENSISIKAIVKQA